MKTRASRRQWRRLGILAGSMAVWAGCVFGAVRSAPPASEPQVNFSFDQLDVRAFVKVVAEITGRSVVVDENVKGRVTVITPPIPTAAVYPLFVTILESIGCSVVEQDGVIRVVQLPPRTTPSVGMATGGVSRVSGLVTRIFRLQHVAAADMRKLLDSMAGREKGGTVTAIESSNHLIVVDTVENLRRVESLIAEVDQPGLGVTTEVVFLQHLDAQDFVQQYQAAMNRPDRQRSTDPAVLAARTGRNLVMMVSSHSNSIVLMGTPSDISEVKQVLARLDVDSPDGRGTLHAIFLKYLSADEAAKSLSALLERTMPGGTAADRPAGAAGSGASQVPSERKRISIEPSLANNALLIDAVPRDYDLIRELVDQLDQVPKQVLIEVVIAEVNLTDQFNLGVDIVGVPMPQQVGDTVIQGGSGLSDGGNTLMNTIQNGVFPRGITIGVAQGTSVDSEGNVVASHPGIVNINALKQNSRVKILSSIPLLAQDNKEASASIVNNIPVLKSTIEGGSGTSRDVIQNIDRIDVGIRLKLTPHVNPQGEVRMVLNPSIEAVIDPGPSGTQYTPTIAKREVSTTVTVPDGRTIVISGLIREDRTKVIRKVPILGSIPILGWLFQQRVDGTERSNLLIFVTPHVVANAEDSSRMTELWKTRTGMSGTNMVPTAIPADPSMP